MGRRDEEWRRVKSGASFQFRKKERKCPRQISILHPFKLQNKISFYYFNMLYVLLSTFAEWLHGWEQSSRINLPPILFSLSPSFLLHSITCPFLPPLPLLSKRVFSFLRTYMAKVPTSPYFFTFKPCWYCTSTCTSFTNIMYEHVYLLYAAMFHRYCFLVYFFHMSANMILESENLSKKNLFALGCLSHLKIKSIHCTLLQLLFLRILSTVFSF